MVGRVQPTWWEWQQPVAGNGYHTPALLNDSLSAVAEMLTEFLEC